VSVEPPPSKLACASSSSLSLEKRDERSEEREGNSDWVERKKKNNGFKTSCEFRGRSRKKKNNGLKKNV
jgi:hypothetical protein